MRVLIACERSGVVREAFNAFSGVTAFSCDLEPCEDGRPNVHIIGDAVEVAYSQPWDLMLSHPDCTFLTNSAEWAYKDGPYHQKLKPGTLTGEARRQARVEAVEFTRKLLTAPIKRKAVENPIGHLSRAIGRPQQIVQPHWFGDDASKATCLWLIGLPCLVATKHIPGRLVEWPRGSGKQVRRWANQTDSGQNNLTPSAMRWMDRARTYPGFASALAAQWVAEFFNT